MRGAHTIYRCRRNASTQKAKGVNEMPQLIDQTAVLSMIDTAKEKWTDNPEIQMDGHIAAMNDLRGAIAALPAAPMGVKAIAQRVRATLNSQPHSMAYGVSAEFLLDILASLEPVPAPMLGDAPVWKSLNLYNPDEEELVQVLCRVLPDIAGEFPRSSDFPISSGDHAVGDLFVSIGFRGDDGNWSVAGWDMTQDCFTDARLFKVLAWQPLAGTSEDGYPRTPLGKAMRHADGAGVGPAALAALQEKGGA
jgi:hypothetical protein